MSNRIVFAFVVMALVWSPAFSASVPEWLPPEYRFEVVGTSNEVAQICRILQAVRDNVNDVVMRQVEGASGLGPYLQWVVRWSRPGVADAKTYLSRTAQKPLFSAGDFNETNLVDIVRRIKILPLTVKMDVAFDIGSQDSPKRTVPGVDYPGCDNEVMMDTPGKIVVVLRAPKYKRCFKVVARVSDPSVDAVDFKWLVVNGSAYVKEVERDAHKLTILVHVTDWQTKEKGPVIALFAKDRRSGWGAPSVFEIAYESDCVHKYTNELIESMDYGTFKDYYNVNAKGHAQGFSRMRNGGVFTENYSSGGEMIVESYPSGDPKITKKIRYFRRSDGRLDYEPVDRTIKH